MIEERKLSNEKGEKRDLLSNFVHANEEFLDDGGQRLGEGELIGTSSILCPAARLFTSLSFRKRFYVLPGWT